MIGSVSLIRWALYISLSAHSTLCTVVCCTLGHVLRSCLMAFCLLFPCLSHLADLPLIPALISVIFSSALPSYLSERFSFSDSFLSLSSPGCCGNPRMRRLRNGIAGALIRGGGKRVSHAIYQGQTDLGIISNWRIAFCCL